MLLHSQYAFSTLFSFFVFLALALYSIRFRHAPGAAYFILSMLLNAALAIASVNELVASDLSTKLLWRNLEQLPLFFISISFLGMILHLSGVDHTRVRKQLLWLSLPVVVYLLLIFTDSAHHLMRSHIQVVPVGDVSRLQMQSTNLSLLFLSYAKILALFILARLVLIFRTVSRYNRAQYGLILVSVLIPYILNLLTTFFDWSLNVSISSVPGGVLLCIALFHYQLLRVRPIAKDKIIEHMKEGVVVVDTNGVILDMNPSSLQLFQRFGSLTPQRKPFGQNIRALLQDQPELLQHFEELEEQEQPDGPDFQFDVAPFHYSVSLIPVRSGKRRMGTLFIFTNISERMAYETELLRRATIDGLTQVYNRQFMLETSSSFMLENQTFSFILIDIDYFKAINDQHGHQAGDRALTQVAAILRDTLGSLGIVGRMGGEEFAVSLPGVGLEQACRLAEEIRRNVEQLVVRVDYSEALITCTVSIGVATMNARSMTFTELYQKADEGLYQSKHKGRNQITCVQTADIGRLAPTVPSK